MTAAPQFLRDLAVSRILRSSSPRPKGALERHDLTRFRRLTLHTAQASISLRRFSNASPRWHIERLKRELIAHRATCTAPLSILLAEVGPCRRPYSLDRRWLLAQFR